MTLRQEITAFGIILDRNYLKLNADCQTPGTYNLLLHYSEGLYILSAKCFRRGV